MTALDSGEVKSLELYQRHVGEEDGPEVASTKGEDGGRVCTLKA
jgi:hypothetical protein